MFHHSKRTASVAWKTFGACAASTLVSDMGHQRTLKRFRPRSALLPKADLDRYNGNVRFVPKADSCTAAKFS